jgi:glyoxylase I family protein
MNMEHICLNVPEPVQAARWYCDHLGMRIVLASDKPPWRHFIADSAGTGLIEFYCHATVPVPDYAAMPPRMLHLGFTAEDLEADRARLIAAGAVPVGEIATSPSGDCKAFLRDPWGVALQLVQRPMPIVG